MIPVPSGDCEAKLRCRNDGGRRRRGRPGAGRRQLTHITLSDKLGPANNKCFFLKCCNYLVKIINDIDMNVS